MEGKNLKQSAKLSSAVTSKESGVKTKLESKSSVSSILFDIERSVSKLRLKLLRLEDENKELKSRLKAVDSELTKSQRRRQVALSKIELKPIKSANSDRKLAGIIQASNRAYDRIQTRFDRRSGTAKSIAKNTDQPKKSRKKAEKRSTESPAEG